MQEGLSALVAPADTNFLHARFESERSELTEQEAAEMLEGVRDAESGLGKLSRVGFETFCGIRFQRPGSGLPVVATPSGQNDRTALACWLLAV